MLFASERQTGGGGAGKAGIGYTLCMILVEVGDLTGRLGELLAAIEQRGEWVRIHRDGRPVAELRPVPGRMDPFRQDPELMGVRFIEDPALPLEPGDWPGPE
jgi:antitoxin (DNA-binding transcriptional repressor) of toxin-antitoxin stability system